MPRNLFAPLLPLCGVLCPSGEAQNARSSGYAETADNFIKDAQRKEAQANSLQGR